MKLSSFPRLLWPLLFIFIFVGCGQAILPGWPALAQTDTLEKQEGQPLQKSSVASLVATTTGRPHRDEDATYHAYSYFLLGMIYEGRALDFEYRLRVSLVREPGGREELANLMTERDALWLKAIAAFKQTLLFAPQAHLAHRHIAFAYFKLNRSQAAMEHLSQAASLAPDDFMTHYELGQWLEQEGQIDAALAAYEVARKAEDSTEKKTYLPRLLLHLGDLYTLQENLEAGLEVYRQLLKLTQEGYGHMEISPVVVHTRLGLLLLRAERPEEAREQISAARKFGLPEARYHILMGQVHLQLKEYDEAIKQSRAFLKERPGNVEGFRLLVQIYEAWGQPSQAIIECEASLAQDEGNFGLRYLLGELYEKTGDVEKAAEYFAETIEQEKRFLPSYLKLAKIYESKGDYALALEVLLSAVGKGLWSGEVARSIEGVLENLPEPLKAAIYLEGTSGQETNFAYWYVLGRLYNDVGESQKSMASFSEAARLQPHLWVAYMYMAFLKMDEEDIDEAIEVLEQGLTKNVGEIVLYKMLSQLLVEKEDFVRAEEILLRSLILDRDDVSLRYLLGIVYDELGQDEKSEQEFLKCLELDPDDPDANNALGYFYAERGKNLDEAVMLIKKALKVEPKNGAYLDSLGWAYFKMGRTEEALKLLEEAASSPLKDSVILDHLGDAYYALGDETRAKEVWTEALTLSPKEKEKLEKKIDSLKR